jgi:hypothetical protein
MLSTHAWGHVIGGCPCVTPAAMIALTSAGDPT